MINSWFLFIIIMFCMAELAIQIVISELSDTIKGYLGMRLPYNPKLQILSETTFWFKYFDKYSLLLSPVILILVSFFTIHRFLSNLTACPFCIGFWLGVACSLFYFNTSIILAVTLAPTVLIAVAILERIHFKQ
jgi:hypothetical protein